MDLGSRIKSEREKLAISQDELALRLNISRQAISKWETGKSYPDIETILKLSDIFNLSLEELVKGDKTLQESLIMESKKRISGLTILGCVLIALGVIVAVWGGASYPVNLMNSDYMSWYLPVVFIDFLVFLLTSKLYVRKKLKINTVCLFLIFAADLRPLFFISFEKH